MVVRDLLQELEPLQLTKQEISGHVLIIGIGGAFPERSLICKPTDSIIYGSLRSEVHSVVTIDSDPEAEPGLWMFTQGAVNLEIDRSPEELQLRPGELEHCRLNTDDFLSRLPSNIKFDTVLAIRLQHLENQLREGLLANLAPHVSPGGRLIVLAGFRDKPQDNRWFLERFGRAPYVPLEFDYNDPVLGIVYRRLLR